jgi:hypothetical protein
MKVMYDLSSVANAAEYLEKHNSNGKDRNEIAQLILEYIMKYAGSDSSFVATGGFHIFFEDIGADTIVADVTVNSSFNHTYVMVDV